MKIAGIIAEYNPFHNGHAAQLAQLRRLGAETIVVCMSGDVVQRGSFAVLPPTVRARQALQSGADVVLSLPNPYACKSAEGFAAAGVALLSAFGCDTLAFGAEAPQGGFITAAEALRSEKYTGLLRQKLATGQSFAAARAEAAEAVCPGAGALLATANNNLGVEYCKAILSQCAALTPLPMARVEAQHGDAAPAAGSCMASATFLRSLWRQQGSGALAAYVPPAALQAYYECEAEGQVLNEAAAEIALLSRLRALSEADLGRVRGMSEGLEHRLFRAIQTSAGLEELYAAAKTRRYAHARIRRAVLDAALGYTADLPETPPYLHVLAARKTALPLCKSAALPSSTSLSRLAETAPEAAAVARAHAAAANLAALCLRQPAPTGLAYTQKAYVL